METNKVYPIGTIVLFVSLIVLSVIAVLALAPEQKTIPRELHGVLRPEPVHILPFSLTDQHGKAFTAKNLEGKWSFVFFGFTACPHICPTTLNLLAQVVNDFDQLSNAPANIQVVFVSVDPERDSPEVLSNYVDNFNKDFIGLTGFKKALAVFSRQFGATYVREKPVAPDDYAISHTSSIFLVDPHGRVIASFSPPHDRATIVDLFLQIYALYQ